MPDAEQYIGNAVEGCKKVSGERRFIRLNLHSKENFLFVKCENGCDEGSLRVANGKYRSTKRDISKHGYGLKIMGEIAENIMAFSACRFTMASFL